MGRRERFIIFTLPMKLQSAFYTCSMSNQQMNFWSGNAWQHPLSIDTKDYRWIFLNCEWFKQGLNFKAVTASVGDLSGEYIRDAFICDFYSTLIYQWLLARRGHDVQWSKNAESKIQTCTGLIWHNSFEYI